MSDFNDFEIENTEYPNDADDKPGFADKIIGIFSAPGAIMDKVAKYPPSVGDWMFPVILLIIVMALSTFLYNSNPALNSQIEARQNEAIERSLQDKLDRGSITPAQADQQRAAVAKSKTMFGKYMLPLQIIGIAFYMFLIFFIANLVFFLIAKFALKGEGNYSSALAAYGLSYYIIVAQTLVAMILSLATEKLYFGLGLINFINVDIYSLTGFIYRKFDPFLIWFYIVLGISYAKMFKSKNTTLYVITFVAIWIVSGILFYLLSRVSSAFLGFTM